MTIKELVDKLKQGKFPSTASYEATRVALMIKLTERAISKHYTANEDYLRNQLKKLQEEFLVLLAQTKRVDKRKKRK